MTQMEDYEIVEWPNIQDLMELEDFHEYATLIEPNDNMGIGSSTYLVDKEWLDTVNEWLSRRDEDIIV